MRVYLFSDRVEQRPDMHINKTLNQASRDHLSPMTLAAKGDSSRSISLHPLVSTMVQNSSVVHEGSLTVCRLL